MDRLAAVQELSREAGVSFTGPSTTIGQTGIFLQLVEWYNRAYGEIQNTHATWQFHRLEFSKVLTPSTASYTATALGITNLKDYAPEDWRVFLAAADESPIDYLEWKDFRSIYQTGSYLSQTGRPIAFSVKPDDTVVLFPSPDQAYTLKGEYIRSNDVITTNEGIPIFHADYHPIIIWLALTYYAVAYSEPDKFTVGNSKMKKILRTMERKYLPRVTWGKPLV